MVNYKQYKKEKDRLAYEQAKEKGQLAGQKLRRVIIKSAQTPKFVQKFVQKNIKQLPKGRVATKTFSSNVSRIFGGRAVQSKASKGSVGRPRGVYKNPANVPAQTWYKIQRQLKRQAQIKAEQFQQARLQALARRGVTPQQLQQVQQTPIQQIPTQVQSFPQFAQPQRRIWLRRPIYGQERGLLGEVKEREYATEEAFFN